VALKSGCCIPAGFRPLYTNIFRGNFLKSLTKPYLFMRFYCRASVHLRRKRFAFAAAPRWKGASIDAAEAPLRSANPDKERACCFSSTILANSVGEHVPCASIQLLRAIVSNEENINSVIIAGSRTAWSTGDSLRERTCLVFFIKRDWIRILFASRRRSGRESTTDCRKFGASSSAVFFWLGILFPTAHCARHLSLIAIARMIFEREVLS